jgi:hypothetical protein
MLMPAAVVGSLRRSAMILSGLSVAFAFYDWVEWQVYLPGILVPTNLPWRHDLAGPPVDPLPISWQDHPLVALDYRPLMRVLLLRLAGALPIAVFISTALSLLSQRGIQVTVRVGVGLEDLEP